MFCSRCNCVIELYHGTNRFLFNYAAIVYYSRKSANWRVAATAVPSGELRRIKRRGRGGGGGGGGGRGGRWRRSIPMTVGGRLSCSALRAARRSFRATYSVRRDVVCECDVVAGQRSLPASCCCGWAAAAAVGVCRARPRHRSAS